MKSAFETIVTPPGSLDLTTLAIVKEELAIPDDSTDTMLTRWITEASLLVAGWCKRDFGLTSLTETFHIRPGRERDDRLRLRHFPVVSIDSVIEGDDDPLDETTDFRVDALSGLLIRLHHTDPDGGGWGWGFSSGGWGYPGAWALRPLNIVVTYTGGYDLPTGADPALQQATLMLLRTRWWARTRDPALRTVDIPGVISKSWQTGLQTGTAADGMPPDVALVIEGFGERGY